MPTNEPLSERARLMNELLNVAENKYPDTAGRDYLAYSDALKDLNRLMDEHSELEQETQLPKVLESEGKKKLMNAIRETARRGGAFLQSLPRESPANAASESVPALVTRLQNLLFSDYEMLGAYDPDQVSLSFPEIQENARTLIVDFRGADLKKLGGAQSSRIAMTVVDAKGERRQGVFTKSSYVNIKGKFEDVLALVAKEYDKDSFIFQAEGYEEVLAKGGYKPENASNTEGLNEDEIVAGMKLQLKQLLPRYRKYLEEHRSESPDDLINSVDLKTASDEQLLGYLSHKVRKQMDSGPLLNQLGFNSDNLSQSAFQMLREGLNRYSKDSSPVFNGFFLQMQDGERVDQRNTAMSAVASLLNVPSLVARSENMKYLDENGDVVDGTFMEFSKGMDFSSSMDGPGGGLKNLIYVSDSPFDRPAGIVKSMADLQVLDYICGNVDRHGGNMTYFTDDKGVFCGLQAIDNDSTFGRWIPNDQKNLNQLGGVNKLQVISASMATTVQNLSPEMLRFALGGRGLHEEEIQAACDRLSRVQGALRKNSIELKGPEELANNKGKLCVVRDQDLPNLDLRLLTDTKPSIFHTVVERVGKVVKAGRMMYPYDPKAKRREQTVLNEVGATERRHVAGGIADSMQSMSAALKDQFTGFRVENLSSFLRSSDQFRNMVRSVKAAKAAADKIRKEIGTDKELLDRSDQRVRQQLEKANEAMLKVREATEAYLRKKMKERKVSSFEELQNKGKNLYEQRRIDYARKLLRDVAAYEAFNNPQNEKVKEEKKQVSEIVRKADARRNKPGKPKPGAPGR